MIDKGCRDVILIYSDIELVRAGPSIKGAGKTPSSVLMINKARRDKNLNWR